jgi:acetyl-CoA/propionyl-CoA carboxylase, biotin carboxylase, biotin carboxyl carrier protein
VFDAVLVANRGEIAVRIIRACRELGVRSVAVYSDADRDALHVHLADEAYRLGPPPAAESYLHTARILEVARESGVDAVHPGYGFFSENADFAAAVGDAGLVFIGPPAEAIRRMGDKLSAREAALAADAPVVPGTQQPLSDPAEAEEFADEHGLPIAVKAAFGGGGRGMRVVRDKSQVASAVESAVREAEAAFGRGEVYLERYLERPRHVEIQVLADTDGTVIHLGERDCSLQRRHQKLVEEAPSPGLSSDVRDKMGAAAIRIAEEVGYVNAGTCEFLLEGGDGAGQRFYFLEMNTRLQVEHPVTEMVTGIDLVHAQMRIAAGDGMGITQDDVELRGHAIEVRLNAEDPATGFSPSPGLVERLDVPQGPWVRLDAGIRSGMEIPRVYDSMFGKLVVWGEDRDQARMRMLRALDELRVEGCPTTVPFHRLAMTHEMFVEGRHSTVSVENEWDLSGLEPQPPPTSREPDGPSRDVVVEVGGRRLEVRVFGDLAAGPVHGNTGQVAERARSRAAEQSSGAVTASGEEIVSPMQGTVVKYAVEAGDTVEAGDLVVVVEAMKMENHVTAHRPGTVLEIACEPGDSVTTGTVLARIGAAAGDPGDADAADVSG